MNPSSRHTQSLQRALAQWTAYLRFRREGHEVDWQSRAERSGESLDARLRQEHILTGELDNVVNLGQPSLHPDDLKSHRYAVDPGDPSIVHSINDAVKEFFYHPATTLTYLGFCQRLNALRTNEEAEASAYNTPSVFEQDHRLDDAYWALVLSGFDKLDIDIDTTLHNDDLSEKEHYRLAADLMEINETMQDISKDLHPKKREAFDLRRQACERLIAALGPEQPASIKPRPYPKE